MTKKILIIVSFILFAYSFLACVRGAGEMVLEWNYSFNVSSAEIANAVAVDSDKNIIVAGYDTDTTDADDQWRIMKFDLNGTSLWNYTVNPNTTDTDDDWARGVAVDSDKNIIVVGYDANTTNLDDQWRIMKLDPNGVSIWNYTTNPSTNHDQAYAVAVDSDKNIIVVGHDRNTTSPGGGYQWRIMKFYPNGTSLWNYTVDPNSSSDQALSVAVDSDKNIIVVGYDRNTTGFDYQWRIMKFYPDGTSFWNKTINTSAYEIANGVAVDSDKNIIVVGHDTNTTGFNDQWKIMKFYPDGTSFWDYTVNPNSSYDQAHAVAVDSNKNIIVVGLDTNTTGFKNQWRIMKLDPNGVSIWNYTIKISDNYNRALGVAVDSSDSFTVVGYATPTTSFSDTEWVVMKFTLCGNGVRDSVEKCDYSDPDPDGTCESYQYCNNICQCRDLFDFWVEPNQMLFTIAQKTPINLYIKNTGYYTDSYDVEAINPNPAVIDIDISGSSPTKPIDIGTTELVRPWVTVLATTTSDEITFNVTSSTNPEKYRTAILSIAEGLPISLYELSILGLITLMVLAGIVYFYVMKL